MKKTQKILFALLVIGIIGCWAILAFFISADLIERFSLWASLVIGTATTIMSLIALYVSYLSLKEKRKE